MMLSNRRCVLKKAVEKNTATSPNGDCPTVVVVDVVTVVVSFSPLLLLLSEAT